MTKRVRMRLDSFLSKIIEHFITEIEHDAMKGNVDPFGQNRLPILIKLLCHFRAHEALYDKVAEYLMRKCVEGVTTYYSDNLMWVAPHTSRTVQQKILNCFTRTGDTLHVKTLAHNCLNRHPTESELLLLRNSIAQQPFSNTRWRQLIALAQLCASEEFVEQTTAHYNNARYEDCVEDIL